MDATLIEARRELDRAAAFCQALDMTNTLHLSDEDRVKLDISIARAAAAYVAAFHHYHRLLSEAA